MHVHVLCGCAVAQTASSSSGLEVPHIVSDINFLHMGAYYNVSRLSREAHLLSLLLYIGQFAYMYAKQILYNYSKAWSNEFCKHVFIGLRKMVATQSSPNKDKLCKQPMTVDLILLCVLGSNVLSFMLLLTTNRSRGMQSAD